MEGHNKLLEVKWATHKNVKFLCPDLCNLYKNVKFWKNSRKNEK